MTTAATAVILALGGYRIVRLLGWDDFPPVLRLRRWVTGEYQVTSGNLAARQGISGDQPSRGYAYRRPTVGKLLECAWCIGFWVALAVVLCYHWSPSWTVIVLSPFALSTIYAFTARWLDP